MLPDMNKSISKDHRHSALPAHTFLKSKFPPNGPFNKLKARLGAGGNWQAVTLRSLQSPPLQFMH